MLKPSTTVSVGPTGIDYGDPEAGYAWARNPDGTVALSQDPNTGFMRPVAVPIAGGKVEQAAQAAEEAAAAQKEQQAVYADVVTDTVDDLIAKAEEFSVTGMFSLINFIPGTPQHDAARMVETIKANVGFDRLQQMREASDTGGALGQVSEFENRLLQSTIGNLELSQTQEQFLKNLRRVKDIYTRIITKGIKPGEEGGSGAQAVDPAVINQRGVEIEQTFRTQNQNLSDDQIRLLVKEQLKKEYGLGR